MKHIRIISATVTALVALASGACAACFADHTSKKDDPLKLHYGVVELPQSHCSKPGAQSWITQRIAGDGWQLLTVVSVFDETGLAERKASAGEFFLRY